jgi:hypothetical protein
MSVARNITLYPWIKFCQNLIFWQAVWFLFFQTELSAADAIVLYAIYDIGTTVLEVPSGYLSDRLGRWAFWIMFTGFNLAFLPMHYSGLAGMATAGCWEPSVRKRFRSTLFS